MTFDEPYPWNTMDTLQDIRKDLHDILWDDLANRLDHQKLHVLIGKVADLCNAHEKLARQALKLDHLVRGIVKETEART